MGIISNSCKIYDLKEILKYKGNKVYFKSLNEKLNVPFNNKPFNKDNKLIYKGKIRNGKYEGRGTLYDDKIYNGYFKEGRKEGYFEVFNKDNSKMIYEGFYRNDDFNGQGTLYNEEGNKIYEGYFKNGKYEGIGIEFSKGKMIRKMVYENGSPLKECIGVLYDENENEIYKGKLKDYKPEHGENITIYNEEGYISYIGDICNFKYNRKGKQYYLNSNKLFFDGLYEKESLINGKLYDYERNLTYQGDFINNKPKNGKNIKLYSLNGDIIFIGDFANGLYNGNGKLYKNCQLIYDGNFKNGLYEGEGILFKENNIYKGIFKKGIKNGNFQVFNKDNSKLICEGFYENDDLNGQGTIYNEEGNKIYEGYFKNGKYEGIGIEFSKGGKMIRKMVYENGRPLKECDGVLYDENENEIYKGKLKDYKPEHGENITIYNEERYIIYKGEFLQFQFHGKGKLYKEFYLFYEGEFLEGKLNGKGILYYSNGNKCYEGNFENDDFCGEGIKYYDNGAKKIEGIFNTINFCKGKYYSPDNELLYEGKIINEIPEEYKNIKIYNDFTYKEYLGDIKNGKYEADFLEYNPDFFISNNINGFINHIFIPFLSFSSYTGKTALIKRLSDPNFDFKTFDSLATMGFDLFNLEFKKYDTKYKCFAIDLNGTKAFNIFNISMSKNKSFAIFMISLYSFYGEIDENLIENIKNDCLKKNSIIYLVGHKMDFLIEKHKNIDIFVKNIRDKINLLINQKIINKYFEVDAKTGEGIENLRRNIEFDVVKLCFNEKSPENSKEDIKLSK